MILKLCIKKPTRAKVSLFKSDSLCMLTPTTFGRRHFSTDSFYKTEIELSKFISNISLNSYYT